jgi:hypothetical protein
VTHESTDLGLNKSCGRFKFSRCYSQIHRDRSETGVVYQPFQSYSWSMHCNFVRDGKWVSLFDHNHFFAKLEGTDSDLDNILHICLDLQENANTKL